MLRNLVVSAFGAALVAGLTLSILQAFTTEPLIFEAERYEHGGTIAGLISGDDAGQELVQARDIEQDAWAPQAGWQRTAFTLVGNIVTAFGAALMLLGGMTAARMRVDVLHGLMWVIAGFAVFSLLPSLGLPPELPGTPAAPLVARQTWWALAVGSSIAGLLVLTFIPNWPARLVGLGLLALPHLIGAPAPPDFEVPFPGVLAGEFAAASLVVSAVMWCVAGLTVGWVYTRLSEPAPGATDLG